MALVNYDLKEMHFKRNAIKKQKIDVKSAPKINEIKQSKMKMNDKPLLEIDFTFETKYEPEVGEISISGVILYSSEKSDEILKEWEDNKKIKSEHAVDILNSIFRVSLTKIAALSDYFKLPPAFIKFPVVKTEDQSKYIG